MKLLLDTHILVGLTTNDERLSSVARALLSCLCRFYLLSKICIDRAAKRWYTMRHERSHNRA